MTRIIHGTGVGVTHGAGDGLSEFPSDLADAGTAGSAAAFSVQTSDASALVTLACSIRGSDAPALCMRVLVAVSVTAWAAGASTAAAGTARRAHVRHPSSRVSRRRAGGARAQALEPSFAASKRGMQTKVPSTSAIASSERTPIVW